MTLHLLPNRSTSTNCPSWCEFPNLDNDPEHAHTPTAEVLARMKLPQRMVFVDALPRLETGKLLRRKLKERFRDEPQAGFALRDS